MQAQSQNLSQVEMAQAEQAHSDFHVGRADEVTASVDHNYTNQIPMTEERTPKGTQVADNELGHAVKQSALLLAVCSARHIGLAVGAYQVLDGPIAPIPWVLLSISNTFVP